MGKLSEKVPWPVLVLLGLVALLQGPRLAGAIAYPTAQDSAHLEAPAPPAPQHGSTVTLNGSVETIFTGTAGSCYLISTNGKDLYFYGEDAVNTGTAAVTDSRLPDPGIEKTCLSGANTKLHFFASAATTATVAKTGP